MDIVLDIDSAFQLIADEKACAFLEKNFSKYVVALYVEALSKRIKKIRDKEGLKSKKGKNKN